MSGDYARPSLGDNEFTRVGTFRTLADGTIVMDDPSADEQGEQ